MKSAANGEGLRQSSHPDVDPPGIDAEMLEDPLAARTKHPKAMGVVDHQPGLVTVLDLDQRWQIGDVAVHAVESLGDDQNTVILASNGR